MKNLLPALFAALIALAAARGEPDRAVPSRNLPTPTTVSPELQAAIARPVPVSSDTSHYTTEQWKKLIGQMNIHGEAFLSRLKKMFPVTVKRDSIAGVDVYWVTPSEIAPENRRRLLVHIHGGGYIFNGGEVAACEAILLANFGQIEVVSIDYRRPPDYPFPAALDDSIAVWREVIKAHPPRNLGLCGTSAGGNLVLAAVLRMKQLGLPLPGALMVGTPGSDLTNMGDTNYTNAYVDNVIAPNFGKDDGLLKLYTGSHDLKDPLLSPMYGDFSGFPPAILISGTRDILLSSTVRAHQKLLKSGCTAELLVLEGESHAQYDSVPDAPETGDVFREVRHFFDTHLDR